MSSTTERQVDRRPDDWKDAPPDAQIEALGKALARLKYDLARDRIHPRYYALDRWALKTLLYRLQDEREQA